MGRITIRDQKQKCLKPCKGLYVDVKKSPADIVQFAKNQLLIQDYKLKYIWFQDDCNWIFQGNNSKDILGRYIDNLWSR